MHERATSSSAVQGVAVSLASGMTFHDQHGEPLESFVRVRDEIRAQLIPEIVRRLK